MLPGNEYAKGMMERIDNVPESRLRSLQEIEKEKLRVAKVYNRKVREKSFQIEELVWKMILWLRSRDRKFGKWSPSWKRPFQDHWNCTGEFVLCRDIGRQKSGEGVKREVLKEVFPQHLTRYMSYVEVGSGVDAPWIDRNVGEEIEAKWQEPINTNCLHQELEADSGIESLPECFQRC
jgi:hypothetical protein